MSMAGLADGAARRRRERQLRSFLRHEELSAKMALARGLHHSAQLRGPAVEEPREVEAQDTHAAPRGLWEPPPGTRPGVLKDPEPQGRLARRELVCDALVPLLVSLHVVDNAHIDHSSLRFFLAQNLAAQKEKGEMKEKEQKAMRREEEEDLEMMSLLSLPVERRSAVQQARIMALMQSSLQARKRKRKKRRKRKTPKTSSSARVGVQQGRCGQGFQSRSSLSGGSVLLFSGAGRACRRQRQW